MSESILKALMQLFAIIATANKEGVNEKSRAASAANCVLAPSSFFTTAFRKAPSGCKW